MPGWAAGAYNGPVGEAYFLEDLYQVTRKQEYLDFASEAAEPGTTAGGEPSPPEL